MSWGDDLAASLRAEVERLEDAIDDLVMPADTQELLGVETWEARAVQLEGVVEGWRCVAKELGKQRDQAWQAIRDLYEAERACGEDPENLARCPLWAVVPGLTEEADRG